MPQKESVARTVNPPKPRIFLADLEYAKKEEWKRRRKLRLKQVRQQARDVASIIRTQAITARKRNDIVNKCEELNKELNSEESKKAELERKLSQCLTSVGTGHSSATVLTEVDDLVRHRKELLNTLAQVRAELAAEKAKETRKTRSEVAENRRESTSISKVTTGKPIVRPAVKKYFPALVPSSSCNIPATPPNLVSTKRPEVNAGSSESVASQPVEEKTILSPPLASNVRSAIRIDKHIEDSSYLDGRKSCPPVTEVIEDEDVSSDGGSGHSWPRTSVKKKSSKVRMYDHSAQKCTEYVQQCGIVRMESPEGMNMKDLIQEEEDLLSKKTDEELESRRVELQRGVRALREEIAKQDWDSAITKLCRFAKEKRIEKSLMSSSGPNREGLETSGKDSDKRTVGAVKIGQGNSNKEAAQHADSEKNEEELTIPDTRRGDEADSSKKHHPPVKVPSATLSAIVRRFNRQREAVLHERSINTESDHSESEDADQLPLWLQTEVEAQNATLRENQGSHPDRVSTPETMMESQNESKLQDASSSLSSSTNDNTESSRLISPKGTTKKHVAFQSDSPKEQAVSSRETSNSASSGDINLEIRFNKSAPPSRTSAERKSPRSSLDNKSSTTSPNKDSSSTSYYSPPNQLSPQQLSLLSNILSRMSIKTRNPVLQHYIERVLGMSRQSVSDLNASSSSELSLQSDIFKKSQSTPQKPLPRARTIRSQYNSSTAVSVSSAPCDSAGEASSSENGAEIAALLRNIMELHRLCRSATSSDLLSDSLSSYRSVPDQISTDRCKYLAPVIGPFENYCEETGIFESEQKIDGHQPMFYTIFDKDKTEIDIPCELFPKPIFAAADRQPASGNFERRFVDAPDGYAMRPEHDPISLQLPSGMQQVISSLSDVESEVSSIQSTPTKILSRRSTSPMSVAASDDKDSTISGISSSDFINSVELRNNDLIGSTSSSTSDFEDVFRSLGLGWALTTLRRIRNAQNLPADDSSSKTTADVYSALTSSDSTCSPSYRHSTPVKPKQCPKPIMESSENDAVPSLTPPNLTLLCSSLQK